MTVVSNIMVFALPPVPIELLSDLLENGPLIKSGIAEFVYQKRIEPAGESFFFKFETEKLSSLKKDAPSKVKESISNQDERNEEVSSEYKKGGFSSKMGSDTNARIVTLTRLKELVEEKETLYDKLGIDESVGIKEIKQAYRKLVLSHHPDKKSREINSTAGSDQFLRIQEAYEILSNKNLRHKYDSALPFDDSIPTSYSNDNYCFDDFKKFFSPIFNRNSRWSAYKPVPELGEEDDDIRTVERFYEFWRGFHSNRDFSIHDVHETTQAESREEKRWMERQNLKIRSKYLRNEILRINKLVDLAYKHDPRIRLHYENISRYKQNERLKKEQERKNKEEEERFKQEETKRKAVELKLAIKSLRISIRNSMREISEIEQFFDILRIKENYFSDGIKIIMEYAEWRDKFLESILASHVDSIQNEYLISGLTFRQWEEWLLKIDLTELEQLDAFLKRWLKEYGNKSKSNELINKLYIIYCMRISALKSIGSRKMEKERPSFKSLEDKFISGVEKIQKPTIELKRDSEWTVSELSLLAKALQKYPGGFKNRWDMISEFFKNTKTKEQILNKVREISESDKVANLSNEVKKESPFDTFVQNNKGVLKKCENTPDIRDIVETSTLRSVKNDSRNKIDAGNELWTKEQQTALEDALKKYPSSLSFKERWDLISSSVPNKNASQCLARFRFIRERIIREQTTNYLK